ncbi:N-acetylmuramoyl-L-alanine amidase [Clostridium sp. C105KSO13]|uniref:N-acetylmuramoyl-L-alanine amidase n=1 Tax=Clostridium sp. C105KSO13 TaxID=1776045 RepID=UPI0007406452|nr:N-acetylmuramoyl-L-alanine amidase [Clostridium sp. C105KSO13]CUX37027.1 Germination-specific N-acetylmuramoyl-L-alanine amidase precursor [Clostridium sp. C105KSO13]
MRRKFGILGLLVLLVCAVIGSQRAGEYLYRNYINRDTKETAASGTKEKQVIIIDPGHGGRDPGKVGVTKTQEKDLNLQISLKVKTMLEKQGIKVIMTREDDNGLGDSKVEDMKKRVSIINNEKPVLAVSIHQNSYHEESIHGAQVFYFTHSSEGEKLAKIMQEALLDADPDNTRQAKANDTYYMLKKTDAPVIIVECGFLSNRSEAEKLDDEEYQNALTKAICNGIQNCLSQQKDS